MKPKLVALGILGLISLISPMIEMMVTGRVETFGTFGMVEMFVSVPIAFWWYHMDKQERNYRAGPLMNIGVVALAIVALPVYFIRSRGWRKGAVATAVAIGFVVGTFVLGELGEQLGTALSS
jgi:hypothetical protein